ncbi:hypothetical protein DFJ74DRAFT_677934 [Hyaloraphidium curvatum]|nr:hypothetical protein DFJ74DRAFT_677934 [Hyaloraphidium curvatum]
MSQEEDAAKPDASCGPETRARRQFQPFTPEELAALLPLKPPPPPPAFFPGDDDASDDIEKLLRPPDPAADARAADPGLRVLAPFPGLALFTRIQGSLVPLTAFSVPMFWLCAAGVAAGLAVALVFLAPAGIARQNLAIGFVFPVVHMLLGGVFNAQLAVGRGFTWQAALCWPRSRTLVQARLAFARAGFFADRLAGFHRWIALSGAGSGDDEAPGDCEPDFVRHLDRDPMCPCPRKSCSGTLPRNALTQRVLLVGSHTLLFMFCFLSILWTPIVTLAGGTWSNAWSGTVVTLGLCATVPLVLCRFPLLVVTSSGMLATSRLRHRAIALCLECTLRSCADVLRGGPGMDGADEYAQLGPRIWGQVRASVSLVSLQPRNIARSIPLLLVYGVANAVSPK